MSGTRLRVDCEGVLLGSFWNQFVFRTRNARDRRYHCALYKPLDNNGWNTAKEHYDRAEGATNTTAVALTSGFSSLPSATARSASTEVGLHIRAKRQFGFGGGCGCGGMMMMSPMCCGGGGMMGGFGGYGIGGGFGGYGMGIGIPPPMYGMGYRMMGSCCSCCMPVCMPMCMGRGCGCGGFGGGFGFGRKKRETVLRRNPPALRLSYIPQEGQGKTTV